MEVTAKFNTIIEAPLVPNTKDILRQIEGYVPVNNTFYLNKGISFVPEARAKPIKKPEPIPTLVPIVLGYGFTDVFCNNKKVMINSNSKIDDFCVSAEEQLTSINETLNTGILGQYSQEYLAETRSQTPKTYNLNDIITTNIENPSYKFPEPKEIVSYINPYNFLMIEPRTESPTLNVYPGAYGSFEIIVYDEKSRQEVTIKTNLQGSSVVNSFIPNVLNSWYIDNSGGVSVRLYYGFGGGRCNYDLGQTVTTNLLGSEISGTITKLGNDGRDYMDLNNVTGTWEINMSIIGPFCTEATVTDVQNLNDNKKIINKNTGIGKFLDNPKFEKNI